MTLVAAGRKVQDRGTLFFRVVMSILTGEKTPVELEWLRAAGQAINARLQVVVRRTWARRSERGYQKVSVLRSGATSR